jgi:CAI-1 autoinducer synthase
VSDGTEQIIALEAGTEPQTMRLRNALQRRGIFGAVFCYPATPKNRSLVRLTFNAGHTNEDVTRLIAACADMRDEVELVNWSSTRRLLRAESSATPDPAARFDSDVS